MQTHTTHTLISLQTVHFHYFKWRCESCAKYSGSIHVSQRVHKYHKKNESSTEREGLTVFDEMDWTWYGRKHCQKHSLCRNACSIWKLWTLRNAARHIKLSPVNVETKIETADLLKFSNCVYVVYGWMWSIVVPIVSDILPQTGSLQRHVVSCLHEAQVKGSMFLFRTY